MAPPPFGRVAAKRRWGGGYIIIFPGRFPGLLHTGFQPVYTKPVKVELFFTVNIKN